MRGTTSPPRYQRRVYLPSCVLRFRSNSPRPTARRLISGFSSHRECSSKCLPLVTGSSTNVVPRYTVIKLEIKLNPRVIEARCLTSLLGFTVSHARVKHTRGNPDPRHRFFIRLTSLRSRARTSSSRFCYRVCPPLSLSRVYKLSTKSKVWQRRTHVRVESKKDGDTKNSYLRRSIPNWKSLFTFFFSFSHNQTRDRHRSKTIDDRVSESTILRRGFPIPLLLFQ